MLQNRAVRLKFDYFALAGVSPGSLECQSEFVEIYERYASDKDNDGAKHGRLAHVTNDHCVSYCEVHQ